VGFLGLGKDEIGTVTVPGQQTLRLPAGKVELRYVEDRNRRSVGSDGGRRWRGPEPDLAVTVTPAGAPTLDIKPPRMISEGSGRIIYKKLGDVELAADSDCTIVTAMTVTDQQFSPRIVFRA
jgi:hypothetical protein